jgi:hypothetical protein
MLIAVPSVLMILLRYVLDDPAALNRFACEFIGVFPFIIMFIITAVTTQRERARGTLERLMAMPLGKLDLLAGYAIAFGLIVCAQVGVVLVISLTWLGVQLPCSACRAAAGPTVRGRRRPQPDDRRAALGVRRPADVVCRGRHEQISAGASWSGPVNREIGVILGFTIGALIGGSSGTTRYRDSTADPGAHTRLSFSTSA